MAIKINLMPEAQKRGWQLPQVGDSRFFYIAFSLFILSLLSFSGLFIYKLYIFPKKLSVLENKNSELTETISNSLDSNLSFMAKKAGNAKILLKDHLYWSKYFEILESFTLKSVYYDQFSVKQGAAKNSAIQAAITGHADNFNALSKQIAIFMKSKEFSNIKFDGGEMDKDGAVNFKIDIEINRDFMKEDNK